MPQLTFDDGFYHASRARDIAAGNGAANTNVLTEINFIQVAINNASLANGLGTEVVNATTMTTEDNYSGVGSSSHFDAFNDLDSAIKLNPTLESNIRLAALEMERVIAYFTRLGYSIKRERDGVANRIKWVLKW